MSGKNSYRNAAKSTGNGQSMITQAISEGMTNPSDPFTVSRAREYIKAWETFAKAPTVDNCLAFGAAGKALKEAL